MSARVSGGGQLGLHWRGAARRWVQAGLERSPVAGRLFWRLPAPVPAVALTFDDGPDPQQTPRILDLLAAHGARATFFVIGEHARRCPELVERMLAEGHAVGNHTYSHVSCHRLSAQALHLELKATDAVLEALGAGSQGGLFRPPFGEIRTMQVVHLLREGRRVVLWSRDSRDYRAAPAAAIAELGDTLAPRDVVLLHDRFPATLEALPRLLERLADRKLATLPLDPGDSGSPSKMGVRRSIACG